MTPVFAEVFDKEPSVAAVWCLFGLFGAATFALALIHRWGIFLALLVAGLSGLAAWNWLRDRNEGPAIVRELGEGYVRNAYIAGFSPFGFALLGFVVRGRKIKILEHEAGKGKR